MSDHKFLVAWVRQLTQQVTPQTLFFFIWFVALSLFVFLLYRRHQRTTASQFKETKRSQVLPSQHPNALTVSTKSVQKQEKGF